MVRIDVMMPQRERERERESGREGLNTRYQSGRGPLCKMCKTYTPALKLDVRVQGELENRLFKIVTQPTTHKDPVLQITVRIWSSIN